MLCGRLIAGAIGGKVSSRSMIIAVSAAGILFLLAGMFLPKSITVNILNSTVPFAILFFILCGLCTSVMWGAIFNLSVEGLGKKSAAASGLFMTMVIGGGILPLLQNAIADATTYMISYWIPVAALAYICWFALAGSRIKKA
jgi:FHS family L-fucose permease-like MFS transporter